jgi:hypothetical protein
MHETFSPTLGAGPARSNSRLAALPRIVSEVDSAPDLDTALNIIVRRTRLDRVLRQ